MSSLVWTIAEYTVNAIETIGIQWYLHRKLGTIHNKSEIRILVGGFIMFFLLCLTNNVALPDAARLPLLTLGWIIYSIFVVQGKIGVRIFFAILAFLILGISDMVATGLLTFLPGVTISLITDQTVHRLEAMVATKMLFIFVVYLLSMKKAQGIIKGRYWAMFFLVPSISIIVLGAVIQYELIRNIPGSFGLVAASIGIFVMNIVLLLLLDRLSYNTQLLINNEKSLQQAKMQVSYFSEIQVANDNMRSFRHDIVNHMQVLSNLIKMHKADQADSYINEIFTLLNQSDVTINCGYPLVDAVLGSKIANAKKHNITISYVINMPENFQIPQMVFCSILGNIMDNAYEACERIINENIEKYIALNISTVKGYVCIEEKNSAIDTHINNLNTKKVGEGHGIGLINIRKTVEKYNGLMDINSDDSEYCIRILLPL